MRELFQNYAAFNAWANQIITDVILEMDEHLHQQLVKSSFPNLYATVLHLWDAESIWWQRMGGHTQILIPSKQFNPTMQEAVNGLLSQSNEWKEWVEHSTEEQLRKEFSYQNLAGESFRSAIWQIVHHLFNHRTYHRGQLVMMMRELGVSSIPATDLIH